MVTKMLVWGCVLESEAQMNEGGTVKDENLKFPLGGNRKRNA